MGGAGADRGVDIRKPGDDRGVAVGFIERIVGMSDQKAGHGFDEFVAPSTRRGWVALVSTDSTDLAERYGRLLECAEIPFLLEETIQDITSDAEPTRTIAVHVPESCFDRACEVVARDHAETSDGRDEDDEVFDDEEDDDDEDPDDDLDDDDAEDDDTFDDDSDDHPGGEPDDL